MRLREVIVNEDGITGSKQEYEVKCSEGNVGVLEDMIGWKL